MVVNTNCKGFVLEVTNSERANIQKNTESNITLCKSSQSNIITVTYYC